MLSKKEMREPIESLIEELSDEEIASCVGGCGWYNERGNECEVQTIDGQFKITEYFLVNGQWHSSSYTTDSTDGLWYDPNGSDRYRNYVFRRP
ncbi:MAG TPA: hypothetical protein IGS40_23635 [Trichormus sp. M33_DOE_039]|nr:hypothetical protein [Trichormus sp. M33_DOE_039]